KNLKTISRNLKAVKEDILKYRPDTIILIDFPGFNLKIASFAKQQGIKVCYYISPKIWAWNQGRVHKIKKVVDHMFCILPFEVDFYKHSGMKVDYVGNPLLDAISDYTFNPNFRQDNNLSEEPIIALLPGSRKMEIDEILPEMVELSFSFPKHQDRKSTRLNSSHVKISYAVFCLKKKKKITQGQIMAIKVDARNGLREALSMTKHLYSVKKWTAEVQSRHSDRRTSTSL